MNAFDFDTASQSLFAIEKQASDLIARADAFSKSRETFTKETYLTWRAEWRAAYRSLIPVIQAFKKLARTHGHPRQGDAQARAHRARQEARALMETLEAVKALRPQRQTEVAA
jgi:hypothetical protein